MRRRRYKGPTGNGRELAMLADGEPLAEILRSMCGTDSAGRALIRRWEATLGVFDRGAPRRKVVELFLRMFDGAKLHTQNHWRVRDSAGFVGRATEIVEADVRIDEHGCPVATPTRRHIAANPRVGYGQAGGLAARMFRHPHTLHHYRRMLRAGGIIASRRTTRRMSDAVLPHEDAYWGYAHIWVVAPSAEMIRRWQGYRPPRYAPPATPRRTHGTPAAGHSAEHAAARSSGPPDA